MKLRWHLPTYGVLRLALFFSGFAGLLNQITWQRALKTYLGSSEALSSAIVVLAFMLGLGLGSALGGRWSSKLRDPARAFSKVEWGLAIINGTLAFAFGPELQEAAASLQRWTASVGLSATILFALLSVATLLVPCVLMGLTMPFGSETAQRSDGDRGGVAHLFAINTAGAVAGTLGAGLLFLPVFGQRMTLIFGAVASSSAALLASFLSVPDGTRSRAQELPANLPQGPRVFRAELSMAFLLGATSLGYEIYLFRVVALAYTPLPWIFAVVLCFYLFAWTLGVRLASKVHAPTWGLLCGTALAIAVVPVILNYHRFEEESFPIWGPGLVYFLPSVGFGLLFGRFVAAYAKSWGRDVGMFGAYNTAGTGVGIVVTTFALFRLPTSSIALVLAAMVLLPVPYFLFPQWTKLGRGTRWLTLVAAALFVLGVGLVGIRRSPSESAYRIEYSGPSGVVEIDRMSRVYIDGLWHSVLFSDDDWRAKNTPNVQRKLLIAVLPFLSHDGVAPRRALNIGMGTGATARTLAKSPTIELVDTYEIVTTLAAVVEDYPRESLGESHRDKIHVYWEDARSGIRRRAKKYDIITQSPLYLAQAGSSLLLSKEYFELLAQRLTPGGIVGIYCNSRGNELQALLVRQTVASVFKYTESFGNGYFIVASQAPLDVSLQAMQRRLNESDPIYADVMLLGLVNIARGFDSPRLPWGGLPRIVTDDEPLVEYPVLADIVLRRRN